MKNSKKLLILGMVLLVLAGIIVVALKGFNVSLMFGKHEVIELKIGKDVDLNKVNEICEEVFVNQKFVIKEVELFNDSFQISVKSITDEEKENLISKVNEKFEVEKTVDDMTIADVSNKRIRDVVKPYIIPMAIIYVITYIYILIRFRKIEAKKIILNNIAKTILSELAILSIIAILRIPVSEVLINGLIIIAMIELVYCINKNEKSLRKIQL